MLEVKEWSLAQLLHSEAADVVAIWLRQWILRRSCSNLGHLAFDICFSPSFCNPFFRRSINSRLTYSQRDKYSAPFSPNMFYALLCGAYWCIFFWGWAGWLCLGVGPVQPLVSSKLHKHDDTKVNFFCVSPAFLAKFLLAIFRVAVYDWVNHNIHLTNSFQRASFYYLWCLLGLSISLSLFISVRRLIEYLLLFLSIEPYYFIKNCPIFPKYYKFVHNTYSKSEKISWSYHLFLSYRTLMMGKFLTRPNPSFASIIISGSSASLRLFKYSSSK